MPVRKIIIAVLLLVMMSGCKKTIERIQENAIMNAMTDGQWIITRFENNGTVITSDFNGYKFQYHKNYTVDAIKDGVIERTGNWQGNASSMTIDANFPGASTPLSLLNGTWHIDNNSWTFVVASQTSASDVKKLRLEKL